MAFVVIIGAYSRFSCQNPNGRRVQKKKRTEDEDVEQQEQEDPLQHCPAV